MDNLRRVELRSDQLHQILDEVLGTDEHVEIMTAVLHARLQHRQRIHDYRVVLAHVCVQTLANCTYGILGTEKLAIK